jgi:S1-C subfamily serine protease
MVQLLGTGLLIKGKQIVNESGDGSFNKITASAIDIRSGGVNIVGSSNISGDLNVQGMISGDVVSSTPQNILEKNKNCLVSLIAISNNQQSSFTGVFIRPDGWVLTSYSPLVAERGELCLDVWGTITNPNEDKNIDIIKAHHIFVDDLSGLCVIKFPDIEEHTFIEWSDNKKCVSGSNCYSVSSYPSISHGLIHSINREYTNLDYVLLDYMCGPHSIVLDCHGRLITVCTCKHQENGVTMMGGCVPEYAKHSVDFMISSLQDYNIELRGCLPIKYRNINNLDIITSGALGILEPKGVITTDGNIITSINDCVVDSSSDINIFILDKHPGDEVQLKYVVPPDNEQQSIVLNIEPLSRNSTNSAELFTSNFMDFVPINSDYKSLNASNLKVIYEETHEEEIRYRKKMYLMDRLKNIKNRKKSRPRVRSRKR